jgi:uncharacterized protein YraI
MSPVLRWNYFIIAAVIITAAAIGLVVPLSSGGGLSLGARLTPIVIPPTSTPTPTATPTETPTLPPPPTGSPTATPTVTIAAISTFTATTEVTVTATAAITPTMAVTLTLTPTATAVLAIEATPTVAMTLTISATGNVRVRQGPDVSYAVLGTAKSGDTFSVIGRNADSTWWQVCCLPGERSGWVSGELVTISGDPSAVPVVSLSPPTSTPTPLASP